MLSLLLFVGFSLTGEAERESPLLVFSQVMILPSNQTQNGGRKKVMSGKWDQDWQEGGQTLPHYQLCLVLYAPSLKPTHVLLLKTRKIFASFLS